MIPPRHIPASGSRLVPAGSEPVAVPSFTLTASNLTSPSSGQHPWGTPKPEKGKKSPCCVCYNRGANVHSEKLVSKA